MRSQHAAWLEITVGDLEAWTDDRTLRRGRSYASGQCVAEIGLTPAGQLLATVDGRKRYAVLVQIVPNPPSGSSRSKAAKLSSWCTCPMGDGCKHAIAAVLSLIAALRAAATIPTVDEHDSRWERLDIEPVGADGVDAEARVRSGAPATPRSRKKVDWSDRIRSFLASESADALRECIVALAERHRQVMAELREQIAFDTSDAAAMIATAERVLREITAPLEWSSYGETVSTPDYASLERHLAHLVETGEADAVVELGREFAQRIEAQIEALPSDDIDAMAIGACFDVIFKAVSKSSLSPVDRVLYAIDAGMNDSYGVIGDATARIYSRHRGKDTWSSVADRLLEQLAEIGPADAATRSTWDTEPESERTRRYRRDQLRRWVHEALDRAGRHDDYAALHRTDAEASGDFRPWVKDLIDRGDDEEAHDAILRGIEVAIGSDIRHIADTLGEYACDIAARKRRWDACAAHAALKFFRDPSATRLLALEAAVKKARSLTRGEADRVSAMARAFLETGVCPIRVERCADEPPESRRRGTSRSTARTSKRPEPVTQAERAAHAALAAQAERAAAVDRVRAVESGRVVVDDSWPLPIPEELRLSILAHPPQAEVPQWPRSVTPQPHLEVFLDLALEQRRPEETLEWYDRLRNSTGEQAAKWRSEAASRSASVAFAIADAFPARAIEILEPILNKKLEPAGPRAYDEVCGLLDRMRPIYAAAGTPDAWNGLVSEIRQEYGYRPRLVERLDRVMRGGAESPSRV